MDHPISLLQRLYQPFFKSLVLCSSFPPISELKAASPFLDIRKFDYINFTESEMYKGFFMYRCLMKVIQQNRTGAKGYFFLNDDVVFNFWNQMDLSKFRGVGNGNRKMGMWFRSQDCNYLSTEHKFTNATALQ